MLGCGDGCDDDEDADDDVDRSTPAASKICGINIKFTFDSFAVFDHICRFE